MIEIDRKINPYGLLLQEKCLFFSSKDGLIKYLNENHSKEKQFIDTKNIVSIAKEWIGFNFHPGQREQCAAFVRDVINEAGFEIGCTKNPSDLSLLTTGSTLAPGYANSFAGDDIGLKITKISDLKEGDIVLFKNTYGNWKDGVITHVGIYIGNSEFIHRPTSSKPVQKDNIINYGNFAEGRRLYLK